MMVGRLLSFWESLYLWAMLNVWGVDTIHVYKRHVLCFSRYKLHRQICDARPCFAENEWHKKYKVDLATNPFLSTPLKTNLELRNWWFVDILRYSFLFHNASSGSMLVFRGVPFGLFTSAAPDMLSVPLVPEISMLLRASVHQEQRRHWCRSHKDHIRPLNEDATSPGSTMTGISDWPPYWHVLVYGDFMTKITGGG